MLSRLKSNIAAYPRLFAVWCVGYVLAAATCYVTARFVGIDAWRTAKLLFAILLIVLVLDGSFYAWVFRSASRAGIFLDMINRFEGRVPDQAEPEEFDEQIWSDDEQS